MRTHLWKTTNRETLGQRNRNRKSQSDPHIDWKYQVDQMTILGRILSQPVTLAVGEVFGISKEMTSRKSLRRKLAPIFPQVSIHLAGLVNQ